MVLEVAIHVTLPVSGLECNGSVYTLRILSLSLSFIYSPFFLFGNMFSYFVLMSGLSSSEPTHCLLDYGDAEEIFFYISLC